MNHPNDPVEQLVGLLSRLPGYGRRSARRAVLKMLQDPQRLMLPLADGLRIAAEAVRPCEVCGKLDTASPCHVCRDPHRERGLVCVEEGVADLWALERAGAHRGLYHVLGGVLSPLGGVGPEDLRIQSLVRRVACNQAGKVGAIGGVREKIKGAERDGATVFLVPESNCADIGTLSTDLKLVKVGTLKDADGAHVVGDSRPGATTLALRERLTGIQYGLAEDVHGWMHRIV